MASPEGLAAGDEVEVTSGGDGSPAVYLDARVVRSLPKLCRYVVEYHSPVADDRSRSRGRRETLEASRVRPRPPSLSPSGDRLRFTLHQPVDAFHEGAWRLGVISWTPKNRSARYGVCFPIHRDEMDFAVGKLRPHLEWVDGKWVTPELQSSSRILYEVGHQVEVSLDKSSVGWVSASVLKTIWKDSYLVEYLKTVNGTELQKEIVDEQHIRPCPPEELNVKFKQHDEVEALHKDGWWPGVITKTCTQSSYMIKSEHWDEEIKFSETKLRHRCEFVDGQWFQKFQSTVEREFREGMLVEVCSTEEGFAGSWFIATVKKSIGTEKFLVEYQDLKTDDETGSLKETVDRRNMRPTPPETPVNGTFRYLEEVDAFDNDGWWVGIVSQVLKDRKYMVYFKPWKEEKEFGHNDLRLHHDWINGKWFQASRSWL